MLQHLPGMHKVLGANSNTIVNHNKIKNIMQALQRWLLGKVLAIPRELGR